MGWRQKIRKLLIPIRDFVLFRWSQVFLRRLVRLIRYLIASDKNLPLQYKRLDANYETFWHSDSDACNSLDPFDVIVWFRGRKFICHGYEGSMSALLVRTHWLEVQKPF